ncbi:Protein kinase domain protein [Aspergillus sclerotialis]|uniref:Protein kinase domain protein n=1 Tax=Aspergillus sclerotialis TaxID=2070753 RepID=A0A3A2ZGK2_9EURO|nr:Protein kinase domain protein [Aspergillus sclerotialis]
MASQRPLYDIGPFWSSDQNTDTQLNAYVSNKHFQIDLSAANFEGSPAILDQYLRHVEHLDPLYIPDDPDHLDAFEDPLEVLYNWALEPFSAIFKAIAPLELDKKYTLGDCLFAETRHYTLVIVDGNMVPYQLETDRNDRPVGALFQLSDQAKHSTFLIYRPDEVQTALPAIPRKVFVKGHACFFKLVFPGDVNSTLREFNAYTKIRSAKFDATVRTPRLHGMVQDEATGRIVGLLLSYINCDRTLLCAAEHPMYSSLRQQWLDQISHTLANLHAHGIIWGDGKPDNVLIDTNNDAYLVDFGGGYTQGWVNKECATTVEGDLQALGRITNYLK